MLARCLGSPRCPPSRCAVICVPCRLNMLGIFGTFDNMLKMIVSPQAKRPETDPRQGTLKPVRRFLITPKLPGLISNRLTPFKICF